MCPLHLPALTETRRSKRARRQQRNRKQKAKKNKKQKQRQYQQHITSFTNRPSQEDNGTGHDINQEKINKDLRVYLQNPNGVHGKKSYYDDMRALRQLKEWEVDIVVLPETNKNWNQPWLSSQWESQIKRVWKHAKVFNSTITNAPKDTSYIHGGVSIIVTNKWSSRIKDHGTDYLGRWEWVQLQGKHDQTITCMAMYRPNPGHQSDGKIETVWAQQYRHLTSINTQKGIVASVDPREQCLRDLDEWIKSRIKSEKDAFILLTDANQCMHEIKQKKICTILRRDTNSIQR